MLVVDDARAQRIAEVRIRSRCDKCIGPAFTEMPAP